MTKRFDVWVTRNHWLDNQIIVSNTATTDIQRYPGCTYFVRVRGTYSRFIFKEMCLKRYGFLPQPATCWNVWNAADGTIHHQEYPLLDIYYGRSYKPKPIKAEAKYYL